MSTDIKPAGEQSGFTLVEVMVAMIVLSIGLMTVAAGFLNVMRIAAVAPIHLAAKEVAASEIDNITMMIETGMATAASMNNQSNIRTNCMGGRAGVAGGATNCYEFIVRTEIFDNTGVVGLRRAEITVSYLVGGVRHEYVKTTAIN